MRDLRSWLLSSHGVGAAKARWDMIAAPAPVEDQEDFDRRLALVERNHRRFVAYALLFLALAAYNIATNG